MYGFDEHHRAFETLTTAGYFMLYRSIVKAPSEPAGEQHTLSAARDSHGSRGINGIPGAWDIFGEREYQPASTMQRRIRPLIKDSPDPVEQFPGVTHQAAGFFAAKLVQTMPEKVPGIARLGIVGSTIFLACMARRKLPIRTLKSVSANSGQAESPFREGPSVLLIVTTARILP